MGNRSGLPLAKHLDYGAMNLATGRCYCNRHHGHGNQLELWSAFTRRPLHDAAIDVVSFSARPCGAVASTSLTVQRYTLSFLEHGYFISADERKPVEK